jgi:ribosomal protein S7
MNSNSSISSKYLLKERITRVMKNGKLSNARDLLQDCNASLRFLMSDSGLISSDDVSLIQSYLSSLDKDKSVSLSTLEPDKVRCLALQGLHPYVETVSVKRGGSSYQVPIPIHTQRQISLSARWLIDGSKERQHSNKEKGNSSIRRFSDARMIESLYVIRDLSYLNGTIGNFGSFGSSGSSGSIGSIKSGSVENRLSSDEINASSNVNVNANANTVSFDLKSLSLSKKLAMHRVAKSNRVFAHRRWH